ncbi:hypothetical protein OF001_U180114 [Pseudomonas sp. OF001]|nr:hypothetical protein OF001_U180114 [Pseudomonas sp. OF001]
MRRDAAPPSPTLEPTMFQSTRPHEARLCVRTRVRTFCVRFNPRARMRRDLRPAGADAGGAEVSIHAPA